MKGVALAFVFLAAGLALGMIWGARLDPYLHVSRVTELAVAARPGVTLLVMVVVGFALYARTLRQAVPLLVALGVTQLVVSIAYAVLVWAEYSAFHRPPVG